MTSSSEHKVARCLLALIAALLLPLSNLAPTAEAQISDLSETEQSNVEKAIEEMKKLADKIRNNRPSHSEKLFLRDFDAAMKNLESLLKAGKIKSVHGLNQKPAIYRENHGSGNRPNYIEQTPIGAYCIEGLSQVKDANGEWQDCPSGTIIIDSEILDPDRGKLGENLDDEEIWKLLWSLADILLHEKYHEIVLNEQIRVVQKPYTSKKPPKGENKTTRWWNLDEETREKKLDDARKKAVKKRPHIQVYNEQIKLVIKHKKELEDERKALKKDRKKNKDRIEELDRKIKWLEDRTKTLRYSRNKGAGAMFDAYLHNDSCTLPSTSGDDMVSLHVLFPGGYWQMGLLLQQGTPTFHNVTEFGFLDEVEVLEPMPANPTVFLVMEEEIFTGLSVQPESCNFTTWAVEEGEIQVLNSTDAVANYVPSLVNFSFRGEFQHMPFLEVEFSIHDSTGAKIFEVSQDENVGHYDLLLPPGDYTLRSSATAAGFSIPLQAGTQFDSRGYDQVEVVVAYVGFVEWGAIGISVILLGMFLFRSYKRFMNWRNSVT